MRIFATSRDNTFLQVAYSAISVNWKDFAVWGVKAEHIERVRFIHCDLTMVVDAKVRGEKESYPIDLPKKTYEEVEALFCSELDGVKVSSLSKTRQMFFPLSMAALVFIATLVFAYFSWKTEPISEPGWFGVCYNFITEKFGAEGILIGGGAIFTVFALIALKVYLFPKKASTVVFKYGEQFMNFKEEEFASENENEDEDEV